MLIEIFSFAARDENECQTYQGIKKNHDACYETLRL